MLEEEKESGIRQRETEMESAQKIQKKNKTGRRNRREIGNEMLM